MAPRFLSRVGPPGPVSTPQDRVVAYASFMAVDGTAVTIIADELSTTTDAEYAQALAEWLAEVATTDPADGRGRYPRIASITARATSPPASMV